MSNNNQETLFGFIENETVRQQLMKSEPRIRESFNELFGGYALKAEDILQDVIQVDNFSGIVAMKDIQFHSMCEHHFAPFFGSVDIYYQPSTSITGLGRLVRLAREVHGNRLQIQETMTKDICQDIMRVLKAKGCFVRSTAKHLCICSRGPKDHLAQTICTYGEGTLKDWVFSNTK